MGGSLKQKAALAAAPDAMKRPAALSEGQPPKRDNDHRAFHGGLPRLWVDTGQHIAPREGRQRLGPRFMDGHEPGPYWPDWGYFEPLEDRRRPSDRARHNRAYFICFEEPMMRSFVSR